MHYHLNETTVDITCTFADIVRMASQAMAIYATPDGTGAVVRALYIARRPQERDDVVLATWADFCEAEGWDSTGYADLTEAAYAACQDDETTITVPRALDDREKEVP